MSVTTSETSKAKELNDLLRHPLATLQETFGSIETEAKDRLRDVLATGNTRLMELDGALAKVTKDNWTVPAMRRQLDELRVRAESLRNSAMKRVQVMPGEAVELIATGSRGPIQTIAKSLAEFAKKLEPQAAAASTKTVKTPVSMKAGKMEVKVEKIEAKA